MALFRAIQVETPIPVGPPDGRYVVRPAPGEDPSHVIVFAGTTTTVIDVGSELADTDAAGQWLKKAGEDDLTDGLAALTFAVHSFRLVIADPNLHPPARPQLTLAKVGFGEGDALSDGRMIEIRTLDPPKDKKRFFNRRSRLIEPQARLAAALSRRELPMVCEELALRAQLDVENDRWREAALQLMVTLDATIAELSVDPKADHLAVRIDELRGKREIVYDAAQTALAGELSEEQREGVTQTLSRIESAFRARQVANA